MLQDDSVQKDGDLYIRSVCFSPDGKYLATGAEDKQIRVSCVHTLGDYSDALPCCGIRFGILLNGRFATFSGDTNRTFTLSTLVAMVVSLCLDRAIALCGYGA